MKREKFCILLVPIIVLSLNINGQAQEIRDSVRIYFRQGYSTLDLSIHNNREALNRIADNLEVGYSDSIYTLQKILVVGGASPEGSIPLNRRLSEKRAKSVFDYLMVDQGVSSKRMEFEGKGIHEPIADNSTVEGRALNRRVEIIILPSEKMIQEAQAGTLQ